MTTANPVKRAAPNRRSAARRAPRGTIKVQCRRGTTGLGPNLIVSLLDVSQTGIRLIVKAPFQHGEEAEVLITGITGKPLKRCADAVWSVPTDNGAHAVGFRFRTALSYAEAESIARP